MNVQKFNYPHTHLGDKASKAVAGFFLAIPINTNWHLFWGIRMFGQPQWTVNAKMHALMNFPNPSNELRSLNMMLWTSYKWVIGIGMGNRAIWGTTSFNDAWKASNRHMHKFSKATQPCKVDHWSTKRFQCMRDTCSWGTTVHSCILSSRPFTFCNGYCIFSHWHCKSIRIEEAQMRILQMCTFSRSV